MGLTAAFICFVCIIPPGTASAARMAVLSTILQFGRFFLFGLVSGTQKKEGGARVRAIGQFGVYRARVVAFSKGLASPRLEHSRKGRLEARKLKKGKGLHLS